MGDSTRRGQTPMTPPVRQAAALLGLGRNTVYVWLRPLNGRRET